MASHNPYESSHLDADSDVDPDLTEPPRAVDRFGWLAFWLAMLQPIILLQVPTNSVATTVVGIEASVAPAIIMLLATIAIVRRIATGQRRRYLRRSWIALVLGALYCLLLWRLTL